jgi:hypothetical protein
MYVLQVLLLEDWGGVELVELGVLQAAKID